MCLGLAETSGPSICGSLIIGWTRQKRGTIFSWPSTITPSFCPTGPRSLYLHRTRNTQVARDQEKEQGAHLASSFALTAADSLSGAVVVGARAPHSTASHLTVP